MKPDSFFDFKVRALLYLWILNCIVIIFAKYSVVPDTYCYRNKQFTHCTGIEDERQKRNLDRVCKYSAGNDSSEHGDNDSGDLCGDSLDP